MISFYYLFIPTWFFTVILYTFLARKYGAVEKYPEEEAREKARNQEIEEYQAHQAETLPAPVKDTSALTKVLNLISVTSLVITLVLACLTMFQSPDMAAYEANREIFYRYGFVCTLIYFISSYWALRRKKAIE